MKNTKMHKKKILLFILICFITFLNIGCSNNSNDHPIVIDQKYRFENGDWYTHTGGGSCSGNGKATVGETTITHSNDDFYFSGVYTAGGGKFTATWDTLIDWDYLYDSNGKIGTILLNEDQIHLFLGASYVEIDLSDPEWNFPVNLATITNGMQDTIQGVAYGYKD